MKKVVTLILTLSLLLCPLGVSAASPQTVTIPLNIKLMNKGEFPEKPTLLKQNVFISVQHYNSAIGTNEKASQDISEYVRDCMLNCMTEISLRDYNIVGTEEYISNYLGNLLNSIVNYYAELFHIYGFNGYFAEYTDSSQTTIRLTSFGVVYNMTETDYNAALEFYNSKIDEIISGITPEMSDLEKALYVHDYLVTHFQYDLSVYSEEGEEGEEGGEGEEEDNPTVYDAYNFFRTGIGVCQAYTQAFNGIMHRLGIKCTSAIDTDDNHTWNIITLNGNNYHIDVTHDDPEGQSEGAASHTHFLLSSDKIYAIDQEINSKSPNFHSKWYPIMYEDITCTDNTYECGYAWNEADSSLEFVDGYWYYIKYSGSSKSRLYRTKNFSDSEPAIKEDFDTKFPVPDQPGNSYVGYFGGITAVGDSVYYTAPNCKVYCYSTKTDEVSYITVTPPSSINTVTSCRYDGNGILKVFFASKYNSYDDGGSTPVTLFTIGDTDGNGIVNSADIVNTKRYLLGSKTDFNWAAIDFGNKKQVNILDLVKIKKLASVA